MIDEDDDSGISFGDGELYVHDPTTVFTRLKVACLLVSGGDVYAWVYGTGKVLLHDLLAKEADPVPSNTAGAVVSIRRK